MDQSTIIAALAAVAIIATCVAIGRPRQNPDTSARYFKCRDCGREHAVYPNGKIHALRTLDEIESAQAETQRERRKRRLPELAID